MWLGNRLTGPPSHDDAARVIAVTDLQAIDAPDDPRLHAIARLAADLCGTPKGFVAFVDDARVWLKGRHGSRNGPLCLDRCHAFCEDALHRGGVMVCEDLMLHPVHRTNPMVIGEPFYRFYAAAPIRPPGGPAIGTVAVLDTRPRGLAVHARLHLRTLADAVSEHLEVGRVSAWLSSALELNAAVRAA
jgi:GAF domain-containing protein